VHHSELHQVFLGFHTHAECLLEIQHLLLDVLLLYRRQLLEDSRMPVSQIALALHYADASAFTRAFRRWSGTTPAQWRDKRGFPVRANAALATLDRA
jgi:AraC-like DNA-binding protein